MMYLLHGNVQPYAWGGYDYIPRLLGNPPDRQPAAELWFGDHAQAPAGIEIKGGVQPLNQWLEEHAEDILSPQSIARFGRRLPFLLKILDVRLPLSIQLHPDKQQAEAGFARENAQGVAHNAAERNYKDDNHKPENMIALSEFWLLHGFAEESLILERINSRPSLASLGQWIRDKGVAQAYQEIMQADQAQLSAWLSPLLAQSAPQEVSDNPDYWLHYAVQTMEISPQKLDAGLISFYLFNIVRMNVGEGIFQRARLPHAYLRGQNVELMAASDNVLRAGLTPKHVDIPELLRIVDTAAVKPEIIAPPAEGSKVWHRYPAPVADYCFYSVHLAADDEISLDCPQAGIVLPVQGRVCVSAQGQEMELSHAKAALIGFGRRLVLRAHTESDVIFASSEIA